MQINLGDYPFLANPIYMKLKAGMTLIDGGEPDGGFYYRIGGQTISEGDDAYLQPIWELKYHSGLLKEISLDVRESESRLISDDYTQATPEQKMQIDCLLYDYYLEDLAVQKQYGQTLKAAQSEVRQALEASINRLLNPQPEKYPKEQQLIVSVATIRMRPKCKCPVLYMGQPYQYLGYASEDYQTVALFPLELEDTSELAEIGRVIKGLSVNDIRAKYFPNISETQWRKMTQRGDVDNPEQVVTEWYNRLIKQGI